MLNWKLNFFKSGKIAVIVSIFFIILSFVVLGMRGMNLGIDFKGGILFEIRVYGADIGEVREVMSNLSLKSYQVQTMGKEGVDYILKFSAYNDMSAIDNIEHFKAKIAEGLGKPVEFRKTDFVGPKIGQELVQKGLLSVALSLLGILVYVGFRFNFSNSVAAIMALTHDGLMVFCFYVMTGLEFNVTSVAVILIILGYSINDTVVILDRMRENKRKYHFKNDESLINSSIVSTLRRTGITSLTTLVVTLSIAIVGGESLRGFATALCFGIVIGTYSTIFIAAPFSCYFTGPGKLKAS